MSEYLLEMFKSIQTFTTGIQSILTIVMAHVKILVIFSTSRI